MSRPHAAQPSARVVLEAMHVAEWGTQRYRTAISRDSERNGLAMSGSFSGCLEETGQSD